MTRLVSIELLKLRTTRSLLALSGIAVGMVALFVVMEVAFSTVDVTGAKTASVLSNSAAGGLVVLLLGVAATTGEFRHGTITLTLLATPDRTKVVAAKILAYVLVGGVIGASCFVVAAAIAIPWLAAKGGVVDLGLDGYGVIFASAAATGALWGAIGTGLGWSVPNQLGSVAVVVLMAALVEPLLNTFVPEIGRFGPVAASAGLSDAPLPNTLGRLPAGGVMGVYALVLASAGALAMRRRDVS